METKRSCKYGRKKSKACKRKPGSKCKRQSPRCYNSVNKYCRYGMKKSLSACKRKPGSKCARKSPRCYSKNKESMSGRKMSGRKMSGRKMSERKMSVKSRFGMDIDNNEEGVIEEDEEILRQREREIHRIDEEEEEDNQWNQHWIERMNRDDDDWEEIQRRRERQRHTIKKYTIENNVKKEVLMLESLLKREKEKLLESLEKTPLNTKKKYRPKYIYNKNVTMLLNNDCLTSAVLSLFLKNMDDFYQYKELLKPRFFIKIFSCKEIFNYPMENAFSKYLRFNTKIGPDVSNLIGEFVETVGEEINPNVFEIAKDYVYIEKGYKVGKKTYPNILMQSYSFTSLKENPPLVELNSIYLNPSNHAKRYWKMNDSTKIGLFLRNNSLDALNHVDYNMQENDNIYIHNTYHIGSQHLPTKLPNLEFEMLEYLINNEDIKNLQIYLNNDCALGYFIRLILKDNEYFEKYKYLLPEEFFKNIYKYKEVFIKKVGATELEDEYSNVINPFILNMTEINDSIYLNPMDATNYWVNPREYSLTMNKYKLLIQNGSVTARRYITKFDRFDLDVLFDEMHATILE